MTTLFEIQKCKNTENSWNSCIFGQVDKAQIVNMPAADFMATIFLQYKK